MSSMQSQHGGLTLPTAVITMIVTFALALGVVTLQGYALSHAGESNLPVGTTYAARNALTLVHLGTEYDTSGAVSSGMASNTWTQNPPAPAPSATPGEATAYSGTVSGCDVALSVSRGRAAAAMKICVQADALPPGTTLDSTQ
jgi:Tfp pilus assembly protein PilV